MLRHKKNDLMHLLSLLESLEKIALFSCEAEDAEIFYEMNDQLNFNATLNLLAHSGEICGKLSEDLLNATPEIEWHKIKGLRNRIVHDYLGLDTLTIFEVIKKNIPALIQKLYPLFLSRLADGTFDPNELNAAKGSRYYRHIKFSKLGEE